MDFIVDLNTVCSLTSANAMQLVLLEMQLSCVFDYADSTSPIAYPDAG